MGAAPSSQSYVAKYEFESNGSIIGANLSAPYDGLLYSGWRNGPFDEQAGDCAYVCAASFPATAAFTANSGAVANMTSIYSGSNVTHFTLSDFFFGCNVIFTNVTEPSTGQPVPNYESPGNCTVSVSAYTSLKKPAVAKQTFNYRPVLSYNRNTGAPNAGMSHVSFDPAFQAPGIKFIKFTATGPTTGYATARDGTTELAAQTVPDVLIDNFNYTVYYN